MQNDHVPVWRAVLGFVLAPLVPFLLWIGRLVVYDLRAGHPEWITAMDQNGLLRFGILVALLLSLVIGVPVFLLLRRLGWNGVLSYLAIGVLVSLLIGVPITIAYLWNAALIWMAGLALIAAWIGILAFWLIVRPDRYRGAHS